MGLSLTFGHSAKWVVSVVVRSTCRKVLSSGMACKVAHTRAPETGGHDGESKPEVIDTPERICHGKEKGPPTCLSNGLEAGSEGHPKGHEPRTDREEESGATRNFGQQERQDSQESQDSEEKGHQNDGKDHQIGQEGGEVGKEGRH